MRDPESDYNSEDSDYLRTLQDGIRRNHACESTHIYSAEVLEIFPGHTIWDGIVEVFELHDHPQAKRAYAWRIEENGAMKFISVLEVPPVESPTSAIEASIALRAGL